MNCHGVKWGYKPKSVPGTDFVCVCGVIPRLALVYVFMTSDLEGSINLARS